MMTNTSSYDFMSLRLMAKHIVDCIDPEKLYTNINPKYPNAPKCHFFNEPETFTQFIIDEYKKADIHLEITIIEDRAMAEQIHGIFKQQGKKCTIIINGKLNNCWKRFTTIKELCSLYVFMDMSSENIGRRYDDYTKSLENAYKQKETLLKNPFKEDNDLDSETYSILLATELMLPIYQRERVVQLISDVASQKITLNDVAKSLLIPEFMLDLYLKKDLLTQEPTYKDFAEIKQGESIS